MKKIQVVLLLFLLWPSPVSAAYVVVSEGVVIEGVNEHEIQSVASISKTMTALLAIEYSELQDIVVVDKETTLQIGSSIYLEENEQYTMLSLLFGLMMRSGNDAAYLIAKHVSGSSEQFAVLMNERAEQIGMKNTTFRNPSGLDETDGGNLSTCYDMALLMEEAMKNEVFRIIVSAKTYESEHKDIWQNKNKLLYRYEYANGGKTGYTVNSGKTLISSANNGKNENVVVSFREGDYFDLHEQLHEKAFSMVESHLLIRKGTYTVRGRQVTVDQEIDLLIPKDGKIELTFYYENKQLIIDYVNYDQQRRLSYDMTEGKHD